MALKNIITGNERIRVITAPYMAKIDACIRICRLLSQRKTHTIDLKDMIQPANIVKAKYGISI